MNPNEERSLWMAREFLLLEAESGKRFTPETCGLLEIAHRKRGCETRGEWAALLWKWRRLLRMARTNSAAGTT